MRVRSRFVGYVRIEKGSIKVGNTEGGIHVLGIFEISVLVRYDWKDQCSMSYPNV